MQCQLASSSRAYSLEPSMDRRRALAPEVDGHGDADDELGVFAAERYFYGDDEALWCERSSSSLSSSAFRTAGTLEHDRSIVPTPTAATTSSEASWNSRSALLRNNEPPPAAAAKLRAGTATPVAGAEPVVSGAESDERAAHRRASSSSSNLRRWLLGCACGGGDGEEWVSAADEMEASNDVLGVGGKKCNTVASNLSPRTEMVPFEEPTVVTVKPGSGRWLLGGDEFLAGREAFSPIEIARHSHRLDTNSGEMSDERRRTKSLEKFRELSDGTLGSATQSSGFTIVAGNVHAPPHTAAGGGGGGRSPGATEEGDAAAASEVGCAYPPSEASVVWSVVTADGAASAGNFSSAASGYYHHHHHHYFTSCGEDGAAMGHRRRRRSGIAAASSLLACVSDKAVDAVGPVHRPEVEPAAAVARLGDAGGSRNGRGGHGCRVGKGGL